MSERAKATSKAPESKTENSASQTKKINFSSSINSPIDQILFVQRTVGNQAVQGLLKSGVIQAKLTIGQPGDIYEQEADRVADQVMRMPDLSKAQRNGDSKHNQFPSNQRMCTDCEQELHRQTQNSELGRLELGHSSQEELHRQPMEEQEEVLQTKELPGGNLEVTPGVEAQINSLRGSGQPLPESVRAFFEPTFGQDFSHVRVHTDTLAAKSAWAANARAYTVGRDVVFGSGQYKPATAEGKRLLAHELTHVVQQSDGACPNIQTAPLSDFIDKDPAHDPSKLTDAQIETTNEFKDYMDSKLIWQTQHKMTKEEALLACRLMLRYLREGKKMSTVGDYIFMLHARRQLGTLKEAVGLVGKLEWVPFSTAAAVSDPSKLDSDFARWILAGGPEPDKTTGKVNCWEMVMFSALKGGFTPKKRIEEIYSEAVKQVKAGTRSFVGDTIEVELRRGNEYVLDPNDPKSPEPLPGDIVIFTKAKNHVAISLGTKDRLGTHKIISHWPPPDGSYKTKETTIEQLLASPEMDPGQTVKFWSPRWIYLG